MAAQEPQDQPMDAQEQVQPKLESMDEETEKKWFVLLDGLFDQLNITRNTKEYREVYNAYAYKIKYFAASIDELKNHEGFLNFLNNFNSQNQSDTWTWLKAREQSLLKEPFYHLQEIKKGFFSSIVHHLFLYGFKLHGDKLILGAYYTTTENSFLFTGNSILTFCKCFIAASAPLGVAIEVIPPENLKLCLTAIATFCTMLQLDSLSAWIQAEMKKNQFLEQKEAYLIIVIIEMMLLNLKISAYELGLSLRFRHAITFYFGGQEAYIRSIKMFREEDTLGLLPKETECSCSKEEKKAGSNTPNKRRRMDDEDGLAAGAAPLKRSNSQDNIGELD